MVIVPKILTALIGCPRCKKKFDTLVALNVHYNKMHLHAIQTPKGMKYIRTRFVFKGNRIVAKTGSRRKIKAIVKK